MPHPPVLLPQIGRGREQDAPRTLAGGEILTARITAPPAGVRLDFLLILSPHHYNAPGALFFNTAPVLEGSLKRFGASEVKFRLTTPLELESALAAHLAASGLSVVTAERPDITPDHGALVPLYFLSRALSELPPVILAGPIGLTPPQTLTLGRTLASFKPPGEPLAGALLASGDFSHRLTREAPAGFHSEGAAFDRDLLDALSTGSTGMMPKWPPDRLADAGECGYLPALTLLGLAGGPVDILSYEAPFGVGYCHALWRPE